MHKINRSLGIVHDAIFYSVVFFNEDNVRSFMKITAENMNDVFENYYELLNDKYALEPSDDLYPFFHFDAKKSCVVRKYLDNHFDFFNGTIQSFVNLLKDKRKFKSFVYYYYLKPFENDINIQSVLNNDIGHASKAVALLSAIHVDYPMQFHNLIYNFDGVMDVLIPYMEKIIHKMVMFHDKRRKIIANVINDFLKSESIQFISRGLYSNEKIDFSKQTFAISFLNRHLLYGSPMVNNKIVLLIGYLYKNVSTSIGSYNHITAESVSYIMHNETTMDIIKVLLKKEKTITQLSLILNYSRPTIDKFVGLLYDELAIKVTRKRGNEVYYKINLPYFIAAQMVMNKAFGKILRECKQGDIL